MENVWTDSDSKII